MEQSLTKSEKKNDLVFVREDNIHLSHWPLARVIEIYPGKDCNVNSEFRFGKTW